MSTEGSVVNEFQYRLVLDDPEYKYELTKSYEYAWINRPTFSVKTPTVCLEGFATVSESGISLKAGFRWNGANIAIDTASFMRASCIHDTLCAMMAQGTMPRTWRNWRRAGREMQLIQKQDGMSFLRRTWTSAAVRYFGFWL